MTTAFQSGLDNRQAREPHGFQPFDKLALFHGLEEMVVVVVGDLPAHSDSRCLVEGPVNTEVDAALTVILFRFGKAGERLSG